MWQGSSHSSKGLGLESQSGQELLGLVGMGATDFVPLLLVAEPALTGRFWGGCGRRVLQVALAFELTSGVPVSLSSAFCEVTELSLSCRPALSTCFLGPETLA